MFLMWIKRGETKLAVGVVECDIWIFSKAFQKKSDRAAEQVD